MVTDVTNPNVCFIIIELFTYNNAILSKNISKELNYSYIYNA